MHEPIKVEVGKLVRMYLVNVTEFDLINSLHLHGMFFDVFRTGTRMTTSESTDTVMLCQGERAVLETDSDIQASSCSTHIRASSRNWGGWASSRPWECVVTPEAAKTESSPVTARIWGVALVPLVLLAALIFLIIRTGPAEKLRGEECRRWSGSQSNARS